MSNNDIKIYKNCLRMSNPVIFSFLNYKKSKEVKINRSMEVRERSIHRSEMGVLSKNSSFGNKSKKFIKTFNCI